MLYCLVHFLCVSIAKELALLGRVEISTYCMSGTGGGIIVTNNGIVSIVNTILVINKH